MIFLLALFFLTFAPQLPARGTQDSFNKPNSVNEYIFKREGECSDECQFDTSMSQEVYDILVGACPPFIDFDANIIDEYQARKSCSAMALDFAARFLKECTLDLEMDEMIHRLSQFKPFYRLSTTTFNSRQAAFNAIIADRDAALADPEEIKYRKMQALSNYHGLKLMPATETITLMEIEKRPNRFKTLLQDLPEGLYIVRALSLADNRKMEKFGHTMIFINSKDICIYYDNRDGAVAIIERPENYVLNKILYWKIPEVRIYRAEHATEAPYNLSTETTF